MYKLGLEKSGESEIKLTMIRLYIVTLVYLTYMWSTACKNAGQDEAQTGSRLPGEISTTSDTQMIPLTADNEEEIKSLLMRVKEESEKAGLKLSIQKTKNMVLGPITSLQTEGEKAESVADFISLGSKIVTADSECSHEIKRPCSLEEKLWQTQCIKKQRYHFADKGLYSQSYGFSSSQARMWELDHKEGWVPKNWCLCFLTVLLEKTLESPLDTKDIKSVNPKGNRPWIFHWRTEAVAPILWPCDAKTWLIGKDPAVGEDQRKWGRQRMRRLDSITNSVGTSLNKLQKKVKDR